MFQMTVSDVFSIKGRGTVATGTVEAGSLRVGDQVTINAIRTTRVDGIEAFRKIKDTATAGETVGLLFKDLTKDDIKSGDTLTGPGGAPHDSSYDDAMRSLGR